MTIYKCNVCGNIITMLDDKDVIPSCCGVSMALMEAKTDDALSEKHVPDVKQDGSNVTVTVGTVMHPMTEMHKIDWIGLETNKGYHVFYLKAGADPVANFKLDDGETIKGAYAYCNVHGLWTDACCK